MIFLKLYNFKLHFVLLNYMSFYEAKIHDLKTNVHEILKSEYLGKSTSLQVVDLSDETIELVTKWRNENWDGFPTKFHAKFDTTKAWLKKNINSKQQILFLIIYDGQKIGHYGFSYNDEKDDCIWFETVVKGEPSIAPGVMEYIETFLLKWVHDEFNVSWVKGYVFSDNFRTIRLHEKCGWLTLNAIPLKREFSKDGWKWVHTHLSSSEEYGERYLLLMGHQKKDK